VKVNIIPSIARGRVTAPPSKSMAHRLLICAGLCPGQESVIEGVELSEDVAATIDCLKALGAQCSYEKGCVRVVGTDPRQALSARLCCRESGSTLRFFIPLALLGQEEMSFAGSEKLLSRPLGVYEELCVRLGLLFEKGQELKVCGRLGSGIFSLPGDVSSQFVSGLLFALPLLEGDSVIQLIPPVESRSYIELTMSALRDFGVSVYWENENSIAIPGGQTYEPRRMQVEGDWSNAAFLSALNLLGGSVELSGLRRDSLQGDRVYVEHFDAIGRGFAEISLADCPDLGPVLFALAAANKGAHFTSTRRLRIKESDRAQAMAAELRKFGADICVNEDDVTVLPDSFGAPTQTLCGHNDHRIVMSMAVLCTKYGGCIEGAQAVRKSYPAFFETLRQLGLDLEITDD